MKNYFWPCVLLLGLLTGCTAERPGSDGVPHEGAVRLFLSHESPDTKSNLDDLPSLDDFEVEIYNARALRLYRDTYAQAKEATIKLNAGDFIENGPTEVALALPFLRKDICFILPQNSLWGKGVEKRLPIFKEIVGNSYCFSVFFVFEDCVKNNCFNVYTPKMATIGTNTSKGARIRILVQ